MDGMAQPESVSILSMIWRALYYILFLPFSIFESDAEANKHGIYRRTHAATVYQQEMGVIGGSVSSSESQVSRESQSLFTCRLRSRNTRKTCMRSCTSTQLGALRGFSPSVRALTPWAPRAGVCRTLRAFSGFVGAGVLCQVTS